MGRSLSWSDELQFRGFVGGYNFDRGVNGFKARAEVVYNQAITTQLLYTRDKLFGSNLMVGCQLQLSGRSSHPSETWSGTPSPFRFVERNYNVIAKTGVKAVDTVAINPLTGKPYVIQHVGLLPLAGPLHSQSNIVNAQAAGADVIYVQANWVLSEKATLTNGQKLIGASNNGTLQVADGRYVPLPSLPVGAQSPRFENITGTAVTLASNTEVAGFTFKNITGNAINASANSNLSIHDLSFQQIQGDAVSLAYSANEFLYNLNFQQVQGNAVYLLDPRGSVGIDNLQMSNVGQGVRVGVFTPAVFPLPASPNPGPRNLAMSNVTIDQAATGVTFANYGGASYFDKISLKNVTTGLTFNGVANARINDLTVSTAQSGVDIQNGRQGDLIRFSGTTSLTTTGTYGLQVANNASEVVVDNLLVNKMPNGLVPSAAVMLSNDTGAVTLGNVSLDATNAIGIKADAVSLLKINGGVITSTNAPALNITNSALNASLGQVSTTGGAVGINLLNDTGSLTVTGFGSVGSGGTIQNTTTGIVQTGDISTSFNRMVLLNNGTGIQSTGARQLQVGNSLITGSTGYAIDSLNDKLLSLQSSTLLNNASTVRMQANQAGTYNAEIVSNTIVDNKGTPLLFKNGSTSATFSGNFQGNDITATHAGVASIDLDWNGPVGLTVASNQFKGTGGGNFGLKVNGTATTTANVYNNSFTFNGGGGSGIALTSAGTSTLQIQSNTIDFRSGNLGIGMRLNLQAATQTEISSNLITDRGGGGSGIIVDHAAANSKFKVDGNVINLSTIDIVGPIIDPVTFRKGIQFATVDTPIQLSGTRDNIVTNSIQPFYIPINTSTGSILVNGVAKP